MRTMYLLEFNVSPPVDHGPLLRRCARTGGGLHATCPAVCPTSAANDDAYFAAGAAAGAAGAGVGAAGAEAGAAGFAGSGGAGGFLE